MSRSVEVPLPYGRTLRLVDCGDRIVLQSYSERQPGSAVILPAESATRVADALRRLAVGRPLPGPRCERCGCRLTAGRRVCRACWRR